MSAFGTVPLEPPVIRTLDGLAPKFFAALLSVFGAPGDLEMLISETLRTDERQAWLFGMGREYDDGRGIVTNAPTGAYSWHKYGTAVDLLTPPDTALAGRLRAANIALGLDWPRFVDGPHLQWGAPMRQSPSSHAPALFKLGAFEAVWHAVEAI